MSEAEVFKPNEKELKLFEQEKMDLYKGTFVVCLVYGLSAFLLLVVILFTEWGKEYIYDKFAPAVITYILGSLVIIIYLLNAIYSIRPRRLGTDMDSDQNIICPDYWKLEKVPDALKTEIMNNNINNSSSKKIIPQINREANANLQYRCVYDNNVYGNTGDLLRMKNSLADTAEPYYAGFNNLNNASNHYVAQVAGTNSTIMPEYIIKEPKKQSEHYQELKKYAKFVGAYSTSNANIFAANNSNVLKVSAPEYLVSGTNQRSNVWKKYEDNAPLICNVVYPQVLGLLDNDTRGKNEVSCEYAKECGVSWSSLKCK